ncbi:hypothetical protein [Deinococcus planocerae]|uniref:hypothetical protein n=1 Tax=Deinococcus planocerae TaxID=1737569 RepID=UPI000C7EB2CF|nr:hypothetical protein [Deinococcus planocerae]
MKHRTMMWLTALTLGVAGAQTSPQTQATPVSLPGTVPASVSRDSTEALETFLAAGGQVQLVDAEGSVIGTLNPDGTVALTEGSTLADARAVQVVPPAGQGEPQTYTLARDLSKPGAIKFEWPQPGGRTVSLPLSALVNRQADAKTAQVRGGKGTHDEHENEGEKAEKSGKEHGGKGKGGK